MPGGTGLQIDFETEPTVCVHCFRLATGRRDRNAAEKISVAVAGAKLLRRLRPGRGYLAAADDVVRFYLENVGEIATHGDLELKVDALHAVVGEVDVFVHAFVDHPADQEAKRALRDNSVRGRDLRIGQISSRGVGGDGPAIEQVPMFAVCIDPPTADNAGIKQVQTAFAWRIDLSIGLGDQHRLPVMDRNLMRANLNLEWHRESSRVIGIAGYGEAIKLSRSYCKITPVALVRPKPAMSYRQHRPSYPYRDTRGY